MSKAVEFLQTNPEVKVCVSDPTYAWIRIHGTAVFENNMAVKEGTRTACPFAAIEKR